MSGSKTIFSSLDLPSLEGIRVITGDLTIMASDIDVLELPDLEVVGRNLSSYSGPTTINLPKLETTGGEMSYMGITLDQLSFPRLESVGAGVFIENARTVDAACLATTHGFQIIRLTATQLVFPHLTSFENSDISENSSLVSLGLPALQHANELRVTKNPNLASIDTHSLATVSGFLGINQNAALSSLSFPALQSAAGFAVGPAPMLTQLPAPLLATTGPFEIGGTGIASISFPALTTINGSLFITSNPVLTSIDLDARTTIATGPHYIENNVQLSTCIATDLRDRLGGSPSDWMIDGNGPCP